jgi:CRISPR-associated protein Csx14
VLELDGQPIDDIVDSSHADGTLNTIHHLVSDLKSHGHHIHLSVSGGRRMIALLAISVATLNFDRYDRIWHINTPEKTKSDANEGSLMHVPADAGIRLIEGPFIALGSYIQRFEGVLISSMKLVGGSTSGRGYMKPAQRKSREEIR